MKKVSCDSNFYVRFANRSIQHLYENYDLKNLSSDEKKLIFFSSRDTYESLTKNKTNNDLLTTITKYFIRASGRTTPYGFLSGISLGQFADKNHLEINNQNINMHLSIDFEWLFSIVKDIEISLGDDLKVTLNNTLEFTSDTIYNIWYSCIYRDNNFNNRNIQLDNTEAFKYIYEYLKEYRTLNQIYHFLSIKYDNNIDIFKNFINELRLNEIIISDLRLNLLHKNYFNYLCNKLSSYDVNNYYTISLNFIDKLLMQFNTSIEFQTIDSYLKIEEIMKKIKESKNYLHIDTYMNKPIFLQEDLKKNLEDYVTFLIKTSITFDKFTNYKNKFVEEYGDSAVKLTDMLNSTKGIGLPAIDDVNKDNELLENILLDSFIQYKDDIDLSSIYIPEMRQRIFPSSLELSFFIYKDNNNNISLEVSPLKGTTTKWQSFGRFKYLFNKLVSQKNNRTEVTWIPKKGRLGNIQSCLTDSKYFIEYGTKDSNLSLQCKDIENIYVKIKNNNFIFYDIKDLKPINFTCSNMINRLFMPPYLKFLIDNTEYDTDIFNLYSTITTLQNKLVYTPRIRYKNIIISPKKWNISHLIFKDKNISLKNFKENLLYYQNQYNIPDNIFIEENDQRLHLNINNQTHLTILYKIMKKNKKSLISESYLENMKPILTNKGNRHLGEFVFQFDVNNIQNTSDILNKNDTISYYDTRNNLYFPFCNWLYLKIYMNPDYQDKFIILYLKLFYKNFNENINTFFFIRYIDDKPHIRIRFKTDCIENQLKYMTYIQEALLNNDSITKITIDTYIPETTRYGGINIINIVEDIFHIDSQFIIDILYMISNHLIVNNKKKIFMISVLSFIKSLNNYDLYLKFLTHFKLSKKQTKIFHNERNWYIQFIETNDINNNIYSSEDVQQLSILLDRYNLQLKRKWDSILNTTQDNTKLKRIFLSLIHMRFNRLIGINRPLENESMGEIESILYSLKKKSELYEK